jgi:hypothetical protein
MARLRHKSRRRPIHPLQRFLLPPVGWSFFLDGTRCSDTEGENWGASAMVCAKGMSLLGMRNMEQRESEGACGAGARCPMTPKDDSRIRALDAAHRQREGQRKNIGASRRAWTAFNAGTRTGAGYKRQTQEQLAAGPAARPAQRDPPSRVATASEKRFYRRKLFAYEWRCVERPSYALANSLNNNVA